MDGIEYLAFVLLQYFKSVLKNKYCYLNVSWNKIPSIEVVTLIYSVIIYTHALGILSRPDIIIHS